MESSREMEMRHRREREELEAEERAAAREAMVREREANAAAETLRNQQAVQDRVDAAAADPARLLDEIFKSGIDLQIDDNDAIIATPPGGLGLIFRRALEQVRPTVVTLLRQRQVGEIL
jgi:hypothetical protein